VAYAAELGAQRLLILPCDLPRLDVAALQAMASLPAGTEVVIAPDRHGAGTNALLVDAGTREFAFGADSLARHIALAEARGMRALTCAQPALAFDLDTAEDFSEWMRSGDELPPFLMPRAA
jgi:2-phospho-L-lactate guanylyltransferase